MKPQVEKDDLNRADSLERKRGLRLCFGTSATVEILNFIRYILAI